MQGQALTTFGRLEEAVKLYETALHLQPPASSQEEEDESQPSTKQVSADTPRYALPVTEVEDGRWCRFCRTSLQRGQPFGIRVGAMSGSAKRRSMRLSRRLTLPWLLLEGAPPSTPIEPWRLQLPKGEPIPPILPFCCTHQLHLKGEVDGHASFQA